MHQIRAYMAQHLKNKTLGTRKTTYWLLLVLYCSLIYYLSSRRLSLPSIPFIFYDKLMHAVEYGVLSMLFYLSVNSSIKFKRAWYPMVIAIVLSVVFGIFDEIHQHFVPFRNADFLDIVADGVGALIVQSFVFGINRFTS